MLVKLERTQNFFTQFGEEDSAPGTQALEGHP